MAFPKSLHRIRITFDLHFSFFFPLSFLFSCFCFFPSITSGEKEWDKSKRWGKFLRSWQIIIFYPYKAKSLLFCLLLHPVYFFIFLFLQGMNEDEEESKIKDILCFLFVLGSIYRKIITDVSFAGCVCVCVSLYLSFMVSSFSVNY